MTDEQAILDVIERVRGRYYGKYRGKVAQIDTHRGRIKAHVPAVLGSTITGWCDPCVPYAGSQVCMAFLPEVDSGVWIEFEGGDISYPIWSGCYWREVGGGDPELPSDVSATVKVIQTKSGHQVMFDDDNSALTITDANGNSISMDQTGISISDCNGNTLTLDASGVSINDTSFQVTP